MSTAGEALTVLGREESGWYRMSDGSLWPGVTTIIAAVDPVFRTYRASDRFAAERGTRVAEATERFDRGEDVSSYSDVSGYIEAWRRFLRDSGFRPDIIEYVVHNPERRYAGRLDRAGRWLRRNVVIDIKTGSPARWHAAQVEAYAQCMLGPLDCAAVYLRSTGTYSVTRFDAAERRALWEMYYRTFLKHFGPW